jgi:sugar transferase (PEP-CTERM/EpsH1 system associated)
MNILFLSTRSPFPLVSGHSLRTYHILRGAARNHEVTLVTFVQLEDEWKDRNLEHLRGFCKSVHPYRIPLDESRWKLAGAALMNVFSARPLVAWKYDAPAMRAKIREILRAEKIDLVHVDMLPLAVYIDEFRELPKLLVNHNCESVRLYRWFRAETNPARKAYLGLQWLKLRSFERWALNAFDCSVVVSEKDAEMVRGLGAEKRLFVVPNGTDTDYFRPGGGGERQSALVWIGHMDVHTNRDAVLYFWRDIYPGIRKRHPDVSISFVGTAPPDAIQRASLHDKRVRVTGFVEDIRPYLDAAAVMVVPVRIGSGTRLKILDGMSMGKAIVSTPVGCEGLNVTDGTNIAIADGPDAFAQKTVELLRNPDVRLRMGREARRVAEGYDWRRIVEEQERVYQRVLGGTL